MTWRGAIMRLDLEGNIIWYRMDSFKPTFEEEDEEDDGVGDSASEYIMFRNDGSAVSITDEVMVYNMKFCMNLKFLTNI